jgi:hypothetical protein
MIETDLILPSFKSEQEEAQWWDANPDFARQVLERAKADGRLGKGSLRRRREAADALKLSALQLDTADVALAGRIAERKGMDRAAYLKELVHTALLKDAESLDRTPAA